MAGIACGALTGGRKPDGAPGGFPTTCKANVSTALKSQAALEGSRGTNCLFKKKMEISKREFQVLVCILVC